MSIEPINLVLDELDAGKITDSEAEKQLKKLGVNDCVIGELVSIAHGGDCMAVDDDGNETPKFWLDNPQYKPAKNRP